MTTARRAVPVAGENSFEPASPLPAAALSTPWDAREPRGDVSAAALAELQDALGAALLTSAEEVRPYQRDTSRAVPAGRPVAVVTARSTDDVRTALRWASRYRVPVSVRGAGTGLSGGAVSYDGGLVVSVAGMNRILSIDPANRLAEVEPGVIAAELDAAAAEHGLMYAPDPASYLSCSIGGNIATNAGGLRCLAHGVTRDAVAALEVVLADGRRITTGSRTRKNSTGYELNGLFVGSEGTLGVITRAVMRLVPRPLGTPVTFRADFPTVTEAAVAVSAIMAGRVTPEVLELIDRGTVQVIERFFPSGLALQGAAMLVGRMIGASALAEAQHVAEVFRAAGATSVDLAEDDSLLEARRLSNPALNAQGLRASCDVTVPPSRLAEIYRRIEEIGVELGYQVFTVAHAGDGNLHPTVQVPDDSAASMTAAEAVMDRITEAAVELGGQISGEHGIGSLKRHELGLQFEEDTWDVHRSIKALLDPLGILTPGRGI